MISLACISNDASFELDENLSTVGQPRLPSSRWCVAAKKAGVKRFIYASSSSVYGVSDMPNVTEDHPLVPLTLYNKYKGMCEPLLLQAPEQGLRRRHLPPGDACAATRPRQRLDLSVNILTNHAVNNGKITVFGGDQKRPNLHIAGHVRRSTDAAECAGREDRQRDLQCRLPEHVDHGHRPAGEEASSRRNFPKRATIPIVTTPSDDNRSYHVNSRQDPARARLRRRKRTIEDAVRDLCRAFRTASCRQLDDRRLLLQRPHA